VQASRELLAPTGVFYLNMKQNGGERFEEKPGPTYAGGAEARERLQGRRFYAYYQHDELLQILQGSDILHQQILIPGDGGFEFWLVKSARSF